MHSYDDSAAAVSHWVRHGQSSPLETEPSHYRQSTTLNREEDLIRADGKGHRPLQSLPLLP